MPKGMKVVLAVVVPLLVIGGVVYSLAKMGIIPVSKLAQKNKSLASLLKIAGLYHPPKAAPLKVIPAAAPDPYAQEKKALEEQRLQLAKERADFQAQREVQQHAPTNMPAPGNELDPRNVARLASVYEQMPPESVTRIFAKLPINQVLAILGRMDEKQVGQILTVLPPDRAAQLTQALSRPAPSDRTASNTP